MPVVLGYSLSHLYTMHTWLQYRFLELKVFTTLSMETHLNLSYEITQCYLSPNTGERTLPFCNSVLSAIVAVCKQVGKTSKLQFFVNLLLCN